MSTNARREGNGISGDGCPAVKPAGGKEKATTGVQPLGTFRFLHTQFEKDGIIVETEIPETRWEKLYYSIASPALGSFTITSHFKGRETPVQERELKIDDILQMQNENKHLDLQYSKLNILKVVQLLQSIFPISAAHRSATNRDATLLMHESLLSFLVNACSTRVPARSLSEVAQLQKTLTISMASNNVVSAIVGSSECRRALLELSSQLGLANDPNLRAAQRADDERIATILVSIFDSKDGEDAVLRLEGDPAQYFLDVVQETLDKGLLLAEDHSRMARRMIRKLSERCDMLPSSLFVTGVSGREEHPTFGGVGQMILKLGPEPNWWFKL
ncbi:hypothetical protein C8R45DRAFT_516973 [Mycena sanguinolenta]|nr:hypothetical protein C8R45DRAFT_516973 [Mycena sanguinolenta]